MSSPSPKPSPAELERVLQLARGARPPELAETDVRRLVRRSVVAASERRDHKRQSHVLMLLGALSCAALLIALWSPLRHAVQSSLAALAPNSAAPRTAAPPAPQPPNMAWTPLSLALPTGDRLAASPGAQFELEKSARATRRIALRGGSVVFSVEPLASGETFGVQTPHAYVEVRGTVFSVDVDASTTRVRVHEGAVQVQSASGVRALQAGERYGSDDEPVPELAAPLELRARELVEERKARAAHPQAGDAAVGPGSEPPLAPPARALVTLEQAEARLHAGDPEGALEAALASRRTRGARGEWLVLEGDALRSLGRARDAIEAYEHAASALTGEPAARAAFKAADLCMRVLSDPAAALRVLDRSGLDAYGAPLRERSLMLRIEASQRLGLPVRVLAQRYLVAFPDSAGTERVRALADASGP